MGDLENSPHSSPALRRRRRGVERHRRPLLVPAVERRPSHRLGQEDAADVVQNTWLAPRPPRLHPRARGSRWMAATTARYESLAVLRGQVASTGARRRPRDERAPTTQALALDAALLDDERDARALDVLRATCRSAVRCSSERSWR